LLSRLVRVGWGLRSEFYQPAFRVDFKEYDTVNGIVDSSCQRIELYE